MIAWDQHEEARRKRLSRSQPLRIDWVIVAAWAGASAFMAAVWITIVKMMS
jgi:hypothetical protein